MEQHFGQAAPNQAPWKKRQDPVSRYSRDERSRLALLAGRTVPSSVTRGTNDAALAAKFTIVAEKTEEQGKED